MPSAHALLVRSTLWLPLLMLAGACAPSPPRPVGAAGPLASPRPRPELTAPASSTGSPASSSPPVAPPGAAEPASAVPAALFDPPPSGPLAPAPPPPNRPADKVPTADEQARKIADCARFTSCQDCVEHHKCGYCPDTGTCTPGDLFGPYPGTCGGGWAPMQCTLGPRDAAKHDAATRAALQQATNGFEPNGAAIDRRLGEQRAATFQLRRGRCYQITLRLSGDVDERHDLRPVAIAHVVYYEGGEPRVIGFDGYVFDPLCPQEDGAIDVYLTTERGKHGAWRAQLFSAPIDGAELARQRERYETDERRARVSTWCRSCVVEWARCRVVGEPGCAASYFQCLAAARLSPADCERGDTAPMPKPRGPFNEARVTGPAPTASAG